MAAVATTALIATVAFAKNMNGVPWLSSLRSLQAITVQPICNTVAGPPQVRFDKPDVAVSWDTLSDTTESWQDPRHT